MNTLTIQQQANLAEYAVKMGVPYSFALELCEKIGHDEISKALQF